MVDVHGVEAQGKLVFLIVFPSRVLCDCRLRGKFIALSLVKIRRVRRLTCIYTSLTLQVVRAGLVKSSIKVRSARISTTSYVELVDREDLLKA